MVLQKEYCAVTDKITRAAKIAMHSNQLFIVIKYGENKTELFNPHCKCLILLQCLKRKIDCHDDVRIDLIDENGLLANISEKEHQGEYASQYVEGRRTYILIKITKPGHPDTEPNKYEALLDNIETLYPEIAERLQRLSNRRNSLVSPKAVRSWHIAKKRVASTITPKHKTSKRFMVPQS